ncbi:MAG: polyphenol oxidase family protein [Planctomycetota bacterium]|nr:polyphenol oxidase family protein [Planctomycetota bacterium]
MKLTSRTGLRLLVFPGLRELEASGLRCAISTRPLDVRDRRQQDQLCRALGFDPERARALRQVHGAQVVRAAAGGADERPEADALTTDATGCALQLRAADCSLVVVVDPERRAVGAAHAGWRGSAAGVVRNLVTALRDTYGCEPSRCRAAVGPTICSGHYPVGPEVLEAFAAAYPWASECARSEAGQLHFDLAAAIRRSLVDQGLEPDAIEVAGQCTRCRDDLLHSYRRDGAGTAHHGLVVGWL